MLSEINTGLNVSDVVVHRDPRFVTEIIECLLLSASKGNDYSPGDDPYRNVRGSEDFGVPGWIGGLIRATDKDRRLQTASRGLSLNHESVEDSFRDRVVYTIISKILYDEWAAEEQAQEAADEVEDDVIEFYSDLDFDSNTAAG